MPATQPNRHSRRRIAILASIGVHVVLAIGLLCWYVPSRSENSASAATQSAASDTSRPAPRPAPPPVLEPSPVEQPIDPTQIQDSLNDKIESVAKLPDERKLSQLDANLKRLEAIASDESVSEVTSTIAQSLGLDTQMYVEKEANAGGSFDPETAQLDDVTREKNERGDWMYESVLVDAEGRKMTVPMTASEGQTLYETFETMKRFPMARGIYRSVVMPMIQKMLQTPDEISTSDGE
ncbi:hypothetical protein [Stieleria varia]|uniref:Uncharacterized protein n=1 Tax=Stieleria varia TaxID=2528005 RepID=A0A5C6B290_9BACT|nr:hypothetical protein [Stieleria varia]TWU06253.1 hypothetical protein Pla52n_19740 [Stieleria varia]